MPDGSLAQRHRRRPATTSSAATACRRISSATISTASRSRASSAACGRSTTEGLTQLRNVYHEQSSSSSPPISSSAPWTSRPRLTARSTSPTVSRHHPGSDVDAARAAICARKIDQYQLDKVVRHGRIWRLDATSGDAAATPNAAAHAERDGRRSSSRISSHPNGWWRDTAQQLLVLKQDKSVVPALQQHGPRRRRTSSARFTRCGRSKVSARSMPRSCAQQMEDAEPADARAGDSRERDALQGRRSILGRGLSDGSPGIRIVDVVIQAMLTLNVLKVTDAAATIQAAQAANPARGVQEIGRQILNPPPLTYGRAGAAFSTRRS